MRIAVPHNTTREVARQKTNSRLQQLLGQLGGQADELHHEWQGDTLTFKGKARGFSVEGTVEITEAAMILDTKLPLIARPFEGKIRETVEQEAAKIFA